MPKVRDGYRQLSTQIPAEQFDAMERLAEKNGRSLAVEVSRACARHLASPPVIVEESPALPPDVVQQPPVEPKPKRGRPRKESQ